MFGLCILSKYFRLFANMWFECPSFLLSELFMLRITSLLPHFSILLAMCRKKPPSLLWSCNYLLIWLFMLFFSWNYSYWVQLYHRAANRSFSVRILLKMVYSWLTIGSLQYNVRAGCLLELVEFSVEFVHLSFYSLHCWCFVWNRLEVSLLHLLAFVFLRNASVCCFR